MLRCRQFLASFGPVDVAAIALIVHWCYTFVFADYGNYLTGDMRGYWFRALATWRDQGGRVPQFALWPMFPNHALAALFVGFNALHIPGSHWYSLVIGLQVVLFAVSAGLVRSLAERLLSPARATLAALLYAVAWPLLYLGAFLLTENVSTPLFIAALWCVVCRVGKRWHVLSGLLLGVACALRPAFLFPGLALALYAAWPCVQSLRAAAWPRRVTFRGLVVLRPALPFMVPFVGFLLLVCHQNTVVSGGRVQGLGANGGVNFLYGQSGARMIRCTFDAQGTRWAYLIYGPDAPNRAAGERDLTGRIETREPFYNQGFYVRYALAYMMRPSTWARDVGHLRYLLAGHLYPDDVGAYQSTDGLWAWLAGLSLVGAFAAVPLVLLTGERPPAGLWWVLWGLLASTVVQSLLFCCERRYSLPLYWVGFVSLAAVVPSVSAIERAFFMFRSKTSFVSLPRVQWRAAGPVALVLLDVCCFFAPSAARADLVPYSQTLQRPGAGLAVTNGSVQHDPYLEAICTYTPTEVRYWHMDNQSCLSEHDWQMVLRASPGMALLHRAWVTYTAWRAASACCGRQHCTVELVRYAWVNGSYQGVSIWKGTAF